MNYKDNFSSTKYFDKRVPEEDLPVLVPEDLQNKYEEIDNIFESFFDDNSLHLAKVKNIFNLPFSKAQKKKEIKKD